MGKAWIAIGVVLVTAVAGAMGYTIASAVLTLKAVNFHRELGVQTIRKARGEGG